MMDGSPLRAAQVLLNSNIITIDHKQPGAEALAVLHGRFIAVGNNQDMAGLIGQDTQVLDLTGKTVLPGFIDAHIHILNSGIRHVMAGDCDMPSIASIQEVLPKD